VAVSRRALPTGPPIESGGGTTRLISRDWVLWAGIPDRFEAGTPAIINVIAFARALQLLKKEGLTSTHDEDDKSSPENGMPDADPLAGLSGKALLAQLRQALIGRDTEVPTVKGKRRFVNLDNAASTPTFEPVWNTFKSTLFQPKAKQQEMIRGARATIAGFLGAPQEEFDILFTSNTTESINLVAESLSRDKEDEPVVLNSLLEHNSNDLPWRSLPGAELIRLSVNTDGFIDLNEMTSLLKAYNEDHLYGHKRIKLVAVSGASNVLGTINDPGEISRIAHRFGAKLLVDAAQLVAHRRLDMVQTGIDFLAFSAHKAYAPFGTGVLISRKGHHHFNPEELEIIASSGEENAAGIAALGKALELLRRVGMDVILEEEQKLTGRLMTGMSSIPSLRIHGIQGPDSPSFKDKGGVIAFDFPKKVSSGVAKKLALQGGIGVRYGCHCSHILVKHILKVGPGLERFQKVMLTLLPKVQLPGVARVSLGIQNTDADVDHFLKVLASIAGDSPKAPDSSLNSDMKSASPAPKKQMMGFAQGAVKRVFQ
jgi:selenocysteine lyase/cysteine desulfurase